MAAPMKSSSAIIASSELPMFEQRVMMRVANNTGGLIELFWTANHPLVRSHTLPFRSGTVTQIESFYSHEFIVRFLNPINGMNHEVSFTKGAKEENITISYTPEEGLTVNQANIYDEVKIDDHLLIYRTLRSSIYCPRRSTIPDDIVYKIFCTAGFSSFTMRRSRSIERRGSDNEDFMYLEMHVMNTYPPRSFVPLSCTTVVESHDQGWTSEGGAEGLRNSFTWGEVSVDVAGGVSTWGTGQRFEVYRNLRANDRYDRRSTTFDWANDSDTLFMIALSEAFEVSNEGPSEARPLRLRLFTRSLYPGWRNFIRGASIEISFEITESLCLAYLKSQLESGSSVLVRVRRNEKGLEHGNSIIWSTAQPMRSSNNSSVLSLQDCSWSFLFLVPVLAIFVMWMF